MIQRLRFLVPGESIPQGSAKAFVVGKRAVVTSDNPRLKKWRETVSDAAGAELIGREGFGDQPVRVTLVFAFVRPASVKPEARPYPSVRPDVDKLSRAILDALTTSGVVSDDSRVVELHAFKRYADTEFVSVLVEGLLADGPSAGMEEK